MRSPRGYNIEDLCGLREPDRDTNPSSISNSKNNNLEVKAVVTLQAFVRDYMARKAKLVIASTNPMEVERVVAPREEASAVSIDPLRSDLDSDVSCCFGFLRMLFPRRRPIGGTRPSFQLGSRIKANVQDLAAASSSWWKRRRPVQ